MARTLSTVALDYLPLRPAAFAVLAVLASRPRSGIDVMDLVNATVRGRAFLGPGTFYRLMRELRQAGLIAGTDTPSSTDRQDDRQTHHELTRLGRAVLAAETARLTRTLALLPAVIRSSGGQR